VPLSRRPILLSARVLQDVGSAGASEGGTARHAGRLPASALAQRRFGTRGPRTEFSDFSSYEPLYIHGYEMVKPKWGKATKTAGSPITYLFKGVPLYWREAKE